jgi:hypothetical protein
MTHRQFANQKALIHGTSGLGILLLLAGALVSVRAVNSQDSFSFAFFAGIRLPISAHSLIVELGNNQLGFLLFAGREGLLQLRPVVQSAGHKKPRKPNCCGVFFERLRRYAAFSCVPFCHFPSSLPQSVCSSSRRGDFRAKKNSISSSASKMCWIFISRKTLLNACTSSFASSGLHCIGFARRLGPPCASPQPASTRRSGTIFLLKTIAS